MSAFFISMIKKARKAGRAARRAGTSNGSSHSNGSKVGRNSCRSTDPSISHSRRNSSSRGDGAGALQREHFNNIWPKGSRVQKRIPAPSSRNFGSEPGGFAAHAASRQLPAHMAQCDGGAGLKGIHGQPVHLVVQNPHAIVDGSVAGGAANGSWPRHQPAALSSRPSSWAAGGARSMAAPHHPQPPHVQAGASSGFAKANAESVAGPGGQAYDQPTTPSASIQHGLINIGHAPAPEPQQAHARMQYGIEQVCIASGACAACCS